LLTGGIARRRLPPGQHGIPTEQVERDQRERLVAGMAEACAESGYLATSVNDISKRAGVSTQTFYRLFSNKLDCMLVSHEELLRRLLAEIDLACAMSPGGDDQTLRTAIRSALIALAGDPAAARLLTIEIMTAGPEGVKSHYEACDRFATRLRALSAPNVSPSPVVSWALVATMGMRVARRVMDGESEDLGVLEDEFVVLMSRPV
jgi:AcrR family transcriptional regulator